MAGLLHKIPLILFAVWPVTALAGSLSPPVFAQSAETTDNDGDGVPDDRDRCLEPLPGASVADASGCPTEIDPFADLAFHDNDHREWYERYWTGDCGGLSFWQRPRCWEDEDYWFRITEIALEKAGLEDRGRLNFELWSLGRLVGHEWGKKNDIRKIDTGDIERWGDELRAANDVAEVVRSIRRRAVEKLRQ